MAFTPTPGVALEWAVDVPESSTVADAIRAAGVVEQFPGIDIGASAIGLWGRSCSSDARLKEGDRVELYRPLAMDPNEARRLRARQLRRQRRD